MSHRNLQQASYSQSTGNLVPRIGEIEKDLLNYYNVQYYGTLYVGSERVEMQLIFDTGSSWLWLPLKECGSACHEKAQLFDQSESSSYRKVSNAPIHIQYGGGSVMGYKSKDTICLNSDSQSACFKDYNFLSVYTTSDLEGLQSDGILGLAPSTQGTQAEMFIDRLFRSGLISNRLFSFSLGGTDEISKITFGGYDLAKYAQENQTLTWNSLKEDNYWTIQISDAKLGDYTFDLDTFSAIVDTGTSYILMPPDDFNEFRKVIEPGRNCYFDEGKTGLFTCTCITDTHSDFPDFHIRLSGNTYYQVPSTSYMSRSNFKCYFKVVPQPQSAFAAPFWILGDAFLLNYYTVFDLDNRRVGFAGSTHVDRVHYWWDILYLASITLAIYGTVAFLYQWYKERKASSQVSQVIPAGESEMSELASRYSPVEVTDAILKSDVQHV